MSRISIFSKETKLQTCRSYANGEDTFAQLAAKLGVSKITVQEWYYAYKFHGKSAFESSKRNNSYTAEFKDMIVKLYLANENSQLELSGKYNIALSMVKRWIKMYNDGIELKDYNPKGDVYTMKSRKTTYEERLKIVKWIINNDMNYKEAADQNALNYALVYQWVQKYLKNGEDGLKHKKRGPNNRSITKDEDLSEVERLKLELEREKSLREKAEFRLELFKKKEEFAKKRRSQK